MIKTMKTLKWAAFLVALSIVFIAFAIPNVFAGAGLGVSDYNLNVSVVVDSSANFAVARLYNVGDCDLTVSVVWIPEGDGVNIVVPEPLFLKIDESRKVHIDVEAKQLGIYGGTIEFVCESVAQDGVSAVTPGGSTNVIFSVVSVPVVPVPEEPKDIVTPEEPIPEEVTPPDLTPEENDSVSLEDPDNNQKIDVGPGLILAVSVASLCSVVVVYKRRIRKRRYEN